VTKPLVGNNVKRIADDLAHVKRDNERLFTILVDDLLDGDNDTTRAQKAANELRNRNFQEFDLLGKLLKENVQQAEDEAMRLAAVSKLETVR
jgi:hypothetical protein